MLIDVDIPREGGHTTAELSNSLDASADEVTRTSRAIVCWGHMTISRFLSNSDKLINSVKFQTRDQPGMLFSKPALNGCPLLVGSNPPHPPTESGPRVSTVHIFDFL